MAGVNVPGGLFERERIDDDTGAILSDWKGIVNDGKAIYANTSAVNSSVTLYTVPTGKTFYMTSLQMYITTTAAGGSNSGSFGFGSNLIAKLHSQTASEVVHMTLPLPIPMKFTSSTVLKCVSSSLAITCVVIITGYEI